MEKISRGGAVNMLLQLAAILIVLLKKTDGACSDGKVCVQKCCPDKQLVYGKKLCTNLTDLMDQELMIHGNQIQQLPVFDEDKFLQVGLLMDHFEVQPGGFSDTHLKANSLSRPDFKLLTNGSVRVVMDKTQALTMTFDSEYFCLDYRLTANNTVGPIYAWVASTKEAHQEQHANENPFLTYSLLFSSFFLLLVLVVYGLLPELRNLGGLILMCYVGSLMCAYISLFVVKSVSLFKLNASSCIAMTLLVCYFFISAFCWMSVMSYDIWWTFRGYAKARPINRKGERFKFNIYCLFAWGTPLIMGIFIGVMNSLDQKTVPDIIIPDIPTKGCFLVGSAQMVYLYMPMLILILCNWVFYLMTAFNIWRLSRGTKVLDSVDSSASGTASTRRSNKQRFLVYLKLSALMGLSWILEVISSFTPKMSIWIITDAYNIFIGLTIFIIFVCKKKILKMLKKRQVQKSQVGAPGVNQLHHQSLPEHTRYHQPTNLTVENTRIDISSSVVYKNL